MWRRINVLKTNNEMGLILNSLGYAKMPKQKKTKNQPTSIQDKPTPPGPVTLSSNGNISITVLAKPGAKQNTITDLSSDGIGIQIAAPPREGEANSELCLYLARVLDVKKSAVSLDKGSKSRNKVVQVSGTKLTVDEIIEKLKKEIGSS